MNFEISQDKMFARLGRLQLENEMLKSRVVELESLVTAQRNVTDNGADTKAEKVQT